MNNRFSFNWINFILGIVGVFVFIGVIFISVFLGAIAGYEQAEMKFKNDTLEKNCQSLEIYSGTPEQPIK